MADAVNAALAYETVGQRCPLPPVAVTEQKPGAVPKWLAPGTKWMCPDCGLLYTVGRTSSATAEWISFGVAP